MNRQSNTKSLAKRIIKTLNPPSAVCTHNKDRIQQFIDSIGQGKRILDLGSGSKKYAPHIICLDVEAYPNVQVVYNGEDLPFRAYAFDGIISIGVLEHVRRPQKLTNEMKRVLKPQAKALILVAFLQSWHRVPIDYRRWTLSGLRELFAEFKEVESGVENGPAGALAQALRGTVASLANREDIYKGIYFIMSWLVQPIKYLDLILANRKFAERHAGSYYFVAQK